MRVAAALLCALLSGCALRYPPPDPKGGPEAQHPSPERLAELAALTKPLDEGTLPFDLQVYPAQLQAGQAVRVRVLVPRRFRGGRILFGLEGRMSERANDRAEYVYTYENIECGTWTVAAVLSSGARRTLQITAAGSCNADPGGDR